MTCTAWSATDPRAESVNIEVAISDGIATVNLGGDLDLQSRDFLAHHIAQVAAREPQRIVFDMARVRFVDCEAARVLAGTREFLPHDTIPVIRHPRPIVRRILELTGLDTHCVLEDALEEQT